MLIGRGRDGWYIYHEKADKWLNKDGLLVNKGDATGLFKTRNDAGLVLSRAVPGDTGQISRPSYVTHEDCQGNEYSHWTISGITRQGRYLMANGDSEASVIGKIWTYIQEAEAQYAKAATTQLLELYAKHDWLDCDRNDAIRLLIELVLKEQGIEVEKSL